MEERTDIRDASAAAESTAGGEPFRYDVIFISAIPEMFGVGPNGELRPSFTITNLTEQVVVLSATTSGG